VRNATLGRVKRSINVGGYQVAYDRCGAGGPPVVFVSPRGGAGSYWQPVLGRLTEPAEVVVYDRAGIGASDPRPDARAPAGLRRLAVELAALLDRADVPSPRVLVGHSIGALIIRAYTADHPGDVAGLVFVEASPVEVSLLLKDPHTPVVDDGDPPGATVIDTRIGEVELRDASLPQVPAAVLARSPGAWPAEDLLAEPDLDERWQASQQWLANQLGVPLQVAADAGHYLPEEDPALVAAAVDQVVRQVAGS
jgi:pimeloyl-ACP methyl ester carboxylesterase